MDLYLQEMLRHLVLLFCNTEIPVDVRSSCSKYGYTSIPHTYCIYLQPSKSLDVSWIKQPFCIIIHVHYTSYLLCKLNSQTIVRLMPTMISMFSIYPCGMCGKIFLHFQMNRKKHIINDIFTCICIRQKDTMVWILSVGAVQPIMKIGYGPAENGHRLKSDFLDQFIHKLVIKTSQIHFLHSSTFSSSSTNSCWFYEGLPRISLVARERKNFSTLQCLHSTLAAIHSCLCIQHEVHHPNSLKYSDKTICRSPRILQMLRHGEALKIHFDQHFNTNAH